MYTATTMLCVSVQNGVCWKMGHNGATFSNLDKRQSAKFTICFMPRSVVISIIIFWISAHRGRRLLEARQASRKGHVLCVFKWRQNTDRFNLFSARPRHRTTCWIASRPLGDKWICTENPSDLYSYYRQSAKEVFYTKSIPNIGMSRFIPSIDRNATLID
jgi:hypothetical protein